LFNYGEENGGEIVARSAGRQSIAGGVGCCGTDFCRAWLLGALNWARLWFDPAGRETPKSPERKFVKLLKEAQE